MTKSIQEALSRASYDELFSITERAQPHVSFWGARYLTVEGYSGTLHIDALAKRTMNLVRENFEFSEEERQTGLKIVKKINQIHGTNDAQIDNRNCLTQIFICIREIWDLLFGQGLSNSTRFKWFFENNCIGNTFKYYTKDQHFKVFGSRVPDQKKPDDLGPGRSKRWRAPENSEEFHKENQPA